jgi:ADP-heptose:LPS heptosyltransferase/lauroyl/myristoyl acyltransferase
MAILIKATGFILSLLPYEVLEIMTECLARIFMLIPSPRRRVLLSNLRHAFPDWSYKKVKATALESASRMFEMGFFSLCYPFMTKDQLRRTVLYSNETEKKLAQLRKTGKPVLFLIPHVCLFEALATSPFFRPQGRRRMGAIYRPNKNKALDNWVNNARLRTGIDTFSRKAGFLKSKQYLNNGNWLALLFDQNAGKQGSRFLFLDRLASMTPLPDILIKSSCATAIFAFPKRQSFFCASLNFMEVNKLNTFSLSAHKLLAKEIRSSEYGLPEWLWSHSRWKVQFYPSEKFKICLKRSFLPKVIPRRLIFFVRMPNWLGDVVMSLPLLLSLMKERPDVNFILICQPVYKDFLKSLFAFSDVITTRGNFTPSSLTYYLSFRRMHADCHLLFTNSLRGDIEAILMGATHRLGVQMPSTKRPLLSNVFKVPLGSVNFQETHQVVIWEKMARHFGLSSKVSYAPLFSEGNVGASKIGILLGSSNNPSKCWSSDRWTNLCKLYLAECKELQIFLYGTTNDTKVGLEVIEECKTKQIVNMTGETSLLELIKEFTSCKFIIGCDSGGVHLANAFGSKVFALFGPTNPMVTSPCYNSPKMIIKPNLCPEIGGIDINLLSPKEVFMMTKTEI